MFLPYPVKSCFAVYSLFVFKEFNIVSVYKPLKDSSIECCQWRTWWARHSKSARRSRPCRSSPPHTQSRRSLKVWSSICFPQMTSYYTIAPFDSWGPAAFWGNPVRASPLLHTVCICMYFLHTEHTVVVFCNDWEEIQRSTTFLVNSTTKTRGWKPSWRRERHNGNIVNNKIKIKYTPHWTSWLFYLIHYY